MREWDSCPSAHKCCFCLFASRPRSHGTFFFYMESPTSGEGIGPYVLASLLRCLGGIGVKESWAMAGSFRGGAGGGGV